MSMQDVGCNKEQDKAITLPLWQMMHEEKEPAPEDEDKSDRFNCLTSRVRACYLRNLEKVLLNNYELCSKEERSEFPFSKEQVMKAAEQLEGRALRSCMVVILYQRAMMRLTADIKKHTQQLKLYKRLHEIVNSSCGLQDKEVQTTTECFFTDGATQTDSYEIPVIKSEPSESAEKPMTEALCTEPQPIPVLVSGVAIAKPFPEPNGEQHNTFQSTSSQVTNHDKENLMPTKTEKDKVHYKRNTKDFSSREPKISSPPKRPCLRVKSLSLLQKPVTANGAMPPLPTLPLSEPVDKRISKKDKKKVVEAVPDIPLPPCPPPPPPLAPAAAEAVKEAPSEGDDGSSPRMSIEERLAMVFNIPQASSPSQKQERRAAKGRRMSIEERLEAVFRGETINDEDVQSEDEQGNESMETLKNEDMPQHVTAPPQLKLRFIELFGHESDGEEEEEDNEPPYKDKIARWVVECLMPYYRQKLIANRPLFKRLARHIADTVMVNKPLPDKSDVDECVTEFFSYHSSVASERDIN